MSTTAEQGQQQLYGIHELAARWGVSRDLVRRLIEDDALRSVTIAARRLIPLSEIVRVESIGSVGKARKRKAKADDSACRLKNFET